MNRLICGLQRLFYISLLLIVFSASVNFSISIASANTGSVTDDGGVIIGLKQPAIRILALAPHIVENVYGAGAGDLLIGSVNYANYPLEAQSLPKVGSYNKYNNLFTVPADIVSRHTARLIHGAQSVCEKFDIARNNLSFHQQK